MTLLDALQAHIEVCEEIYRLMLELNRVLKAGTQHPDPALLEKKRSALGSLDISLARIRTFSAHAGGPSPELRGTMEKCQRTILKALLIDRENEQLLLKNTMPRKPQTPAPKPTASHLSRLYTKHR